MSSPGNFTIGASAMSTPVGVALQSVGDLAVAVATYAKRGDTAGMFPLWLALAEARINRDLRVSQMITRVNPYVVSAEFQAVPADFIGIRNIRLLDQPSWDLEFLQPDQMSRRVQEVAGITPQYLNAYSYVNGDFWFNPAPAQSWNCELSYYAQIPPLWANTTNWLLMQWPDIYLFAIMREAADFYEDDEQLQKYDGRLNRACDNANLLDRKKTQAFNLSPQPARPQVF